MTGAASSSRNVPKTANPRLEVIELSDTDDELDSESEHETGADGQPIKDAGIDNDDNDESAEVDSDAGEQGVWESESLLEDTLGEMGDGVLFEPHEDACTLEEATEFRKLLKKIGDERFLDGTIRNKSISAKKLITAFGIRPPAFLEDAPDHAFYPLLRMGISRELMRRSKLPHINTLADVTKLLRESENIIVLTGAGISTSLGIPDFRSKEGGLYSRLEGLGLNDPQEVFDIGIFQEDPTIFYSVAKDILPASSKFSPTHAFIELLQRKGKLLTQYTQNIDNLEEKAGIRKDKLIQCHGSFATASCVKCHQKVPGQTIFPDLRAGRVARCESCLKTLADVKKAGKKRKRGKSRESSGARKKRYSEDSSAEEEEWDIQEAGIMKPDITFFGEPLPDHFHRRLVDHDREKCDLLICIGTSLQVAPVSEIIGFLPAQVPQIYISKTPVKHIEFDVELLGACDDVVVELCRLAKWKLEHEMIPEKIEVDVSLQEGKESRYIFTVK